MTGYEALRSAAAWIDLTDRGKIRLTGEDRARLLHALTTNSIQDLAAGHGRYAFFLNDKGRILGDAYIYNFGESLLLDTEPETAGKLLAHLDRYIIADDVTLDDETGKWAAIGLEGPASHRAALGLGISAPEEAYAVRESGEGFAANVAAAARQGVRIFVPSDERNRLLEKLSAAGIEKASAEEARLVRIENGRPRYGEEISERYLVQETQATHAVHFSKGCYLGQEIVERVRSRGQVHRLLSAIQIDGENIPAAGTKLVAPDGAVLGEIASAAYSPALGNVVGLAYVRAEALNNKPEMMVANSHPPVKVRVA